MFAQPLLIGSGDAGDRGESDVGELEDSALSLRCTLSELRTLAAPELCVPNGTE
jgi:hypothetical protein